jgi:PTH1 family peptidyl-tRNA hydrolase
MIKLIVGLGNIGYQYSNTRHNAGFWMVDEIARRYQAIFKLESKFFAEVARIKHNNQDFFLLKPQTLMNLSGKAVVALALFYKILPEQILVIHDELDFKPGVAKLKFAGGNGGHNGLRDIDRVIGKNYWRLRLGIGRPVDSSKMIGYVLGSPPKQEEMYIHNAIDNALELFDEIIAGNFASATKKLHTQ